MEEKPADPNAELKPPKACNWGIEEEKLLAKWADKAACYRWLHDAAEKKYSRRNMWVTIPVIVLSTLTGTANFGLGSTVPAALQTIAQLTIGGVSVLTGIISTVANFLRYAQKMESHRGASISWGKLYRKISVELSLGRPQREACMDFILVCRSELDRLTEQSPSIPEKILKSFRAEFTDKVELTDPIKWNDMTKTEAHPVSIEIDEECADDGPVSIDDKVAEVIETVTSRPKNQKLSQLRRELAFARVLAPKQKPAVSDENV